MELLYKQYQSEQKRYKFFVSLLRYFGLSMLGLYLYLLFSYKGLEPKYFLLNLYAIYCNASVLILFQYYKIPQIFENLFSNNELLVKESYRIINDYREEIYKSFLMELFGRNYAQVQFNFDLEEMRMLILSEKNLNWKKIGKIYFTLFFLISAILFYFLYPLEYIESAN